ncbi:hypothetical protein RvY_12351 [Ramazzottius varieornatus]|uniref:Uncharacterized protein n=1 Tax=Ramazzottius varieornatus TaxID=947166 RepID=A0A1D1VJ76_RAMVA|nr:hypothetical protein RvY_12351 [Ramazzottius varieornatus]
MATVYLTYIGYKSFSYDPETDGYCFSMFVGGFYAPGESGQKGIWRAPCNLVYRESRSESVNCLLRRAAHLNKEIHIVLLGDSRVRQIRDGLINHLSGVEHDIYVNPAVPYTQQYRESLNVTIASANTRIEFFWAVEVDEHGGTFGQALRALQNSSAKPDIIIVGAGIWMMKQCTTQNVTQVECVKRFKR